MSDNGSTHRAPSRGQFRADIPTVAESSIEEGRFGRLFRNLPSHRPSDDQLSSMAAGMVEADSGDSTLPAGITYLGQFIDHDLTFDPVSSLQRQNDPDALRNFRTPAFDLDCVYGSGRDDQPYLYQRADSALLLVGEGEKFEQAPDKPIERDLPRNSEGLALIGDRRNDENIIVSQLQLAFILLHNRLVGDLRDPGQAPVDLRPHRWSTGSDFEEAQRLARWHYQWLVLKFFLPAICDPQVLQDRLEETPIDGRTCRRVRPLMYYRPKTTPYIPVEWSVAAYRFGHSLIRPSYHLNAALRALRDGRPLDLFIENPDDGNRLQHLAGERQLPPFWSIDWRMFFDHGEGDLQHARRIDTHLAGGLSFLPGAADGMKSLALRNLQRGRAMGLPSGQAVARRLCVAPLAPDELGSADETPLWYYILREAEVRADGQRLGVVGSTIVAETMLGMLAADPFGFLRTEPSWEPVLPLRAGGAASDWSMDDLLAYAVPDNGRILPVKPPEEPQPPAPSPGGW